MSVVSTKTLIYVTGISEKVTRDILMRAFSTFGELVDVVLPPFVAEGEGERYAYVQFEDAEDCEHALNNMNGAEVMGNVISVMYADGSMKISSDQPEKPLWELDHS